MRVTRRLLLSIAAALFALYAGQFVLRAIDKSPPQGRVGGQLYTWGRLVETNRLGFREKEIEIPKRAGVYRVMVLGDSFTWGTGLAIGERYTEEAQQFLGDRFEVLNFGKPGVSTIKERDLLGEWIGEIAPDLVVVGFSLNDVQPRQQEYSIEEEKLRASLAGRIVRMKKNFLARVGLPDVGAMIEDLFYRAARKAGVIPTWQVALQRCYESSSVEWRDFVQALAEIKQMSDERGLPPPIFLVLNQGVYVDRPTDYSHPDAKLATFLAWYAQAGKAAAEQGFTVVSCEKEIAALGPSILAVNKYDGHPSARLNRIYGEKLGEEIAIVQGRPTE